MAESAAAAARRMWTLFEPVHAVTYFAPEARAALEQVGLRGFPRGYFAGRAAPLGPVDAPPVRAAFYTFAPAVVNRALPAVWELITPAAALAARLAGAVAALRRVLAGLEVTVPVAADLLASAAAEADCAGRVLAAPNAALPVPDEPFARLWHAATVLREHRGDGHCASLLTADIDGCEALVLRAAIDLPREQIQPLRGWTDEEWDAAVARLADRGLVNKDGTATPAGHMVRADTERITDIAAARPWGKLGPVRLEELSCALEPIARECATELPFPNPIGAPGPAAVRR